MKKRRHHYVWRNYLKPWATKDRIWCFRNGKFFETNLINIGQERDFYKLKQLSQNELKYIQAIVNSHSSEHIRETNQSWIEMFDLVFKAQRVIEKSGTCNPILERMIDEHIHNFEEDFHGAIEQRAISLLEDVLNENLSFFEDEDKCIPFLHFLCTQYMRTNNIKQNMLLNLKEFQAVDIENMWNVLAHVLATSLASNLYSDRRNLKLVLLKNSTNYKFLTGDQPVLNIYATGKNSIEPPEELELYYPVSPDIAVLLTEKGKYAQVDKIVVGEHDIDSYNEHIMKQAHSQIYGDSKNSLDRQFQRSHPN